MSDSQPPSPWQHDDVAFWSITYIHAPRAAVFEALTRPEQTRRYYFGMPISQPLRAGEPMWYGPSRDTAPISGRVEAFEPPARFAHTFAFAGRDTPPSTVEFTLAEAGPDLTMLTLRHAGFADRRDPTFDDISGGWPAILSSLKTMLETGEPIAWPAPAEDDHA